MKTIHGDQPSEEANIILKALQSAVSKELQRKRKLGHYAVFWDGEKPIMVGPDAPGEEQVSK